jgi:hypothetical protein
MHIHRHTIFQHHDGFLKRLVVLLDLDSTGAQFFAAWLNLLTERIVQARYGLSTFLRQQIRTTFDPALPYMAVGRTASENGWHPQTRPNAPRFRHRPKLRHCSVLN